jgi:serine/threonine protein kinase
MIDTRLVNDEFLKEMKNEIEIFRSMDHPNILKAYETFERNKEISIVMELCTGGDLYTRLPYSERQAANIVTKLSSAIAYMHSKRIIHRDCKYIHDFQHQ